MDSKINVFWFRRDLRLTDNAGLYRALKEGLPVLPVFIFDRNILDDLENKSDRRVQYIYDALSEMQDQLVKMGSSITYFYTNPKDAFESLLSSFPVDTIYTNEDYEPYARDRDEEIAALIKSRSGNFQSFKDQVIFSKQEVLKDNGEPYTVFTPYARKWKSLLKDFFLKAYPVEEYSKNFFQQPEQPIPTLESMGFQETERSFPSKEISDDLISHYSKTRDYPGMEGTSRMALHLRFGTISIRELAKHASKHGEVYFNELIWREFYQMILWHFPRVGKGKAFRPEYDNIKWRNNEKEFEAWCHGETGYPLVDAGMRQLNATGFMHNRVRMVTASFLAKHLLIDWRWGEAYFAAKLLDYDLSANNGGWQWAAGSGCDTAPYFRIFNPALQTKRFDKDLTYIRKWVPELNDPSYPPPIVNHQDARERCLKVYKEALAR